MSSTIRGLGGLEPLSAKLHNEQAIKEAMKVICPQHPNRSGELVLRSGRLKSGGLVYFEAPIGCENSDRWMPFRNMSGSEIDGLLAMFTSGECHSYQGPAGAQLHYHVSERK